MQHFKREYEFRIFFYYSLSNFWNSASFDQNKKTRITAGLNNFLIRGLVFTPGFGWLVFFGYG